MHHIINLNHHEGREVHEETVKSFIQLYLRVLRALRG